MFVGREDVRVRMGRDGIEAMVTVGCGFVCSVE